MHDLTKTIGNSYDLVRGSTGVNSPTRMGEGFVLISTWVSAARDFIPLIPLLN